LRVLIEVAADSWLGAAVPDESAELGG
jgi:hypothetical protein